MNIQKCIEEMKTIHESLLNLLESETNIEEEFQNLLLYIEDYKICEEKHKIRSILNLILKIANNHYRGSSFFTKIFKILTVLKISIKKYFTNLEIFKIFKSNKRILLFLIEEQIIKIDNYIVKLFFTEKYINFKYPQYFAPEISPIIDKKLINLKDKNELLEEITKELPSNFYESRKLGENDQLICRYIQQDLIKEFIVYVNRNNTFLDEVIQPSIYETNELILRMNANKSQIRLIEYAAFYGSIQIFNYLRINKVILTPSIWIYAIHGKNAEIIHILEENKVWNEDPTYKNILFESIKCHHNDVVNYIQNNYLKENIDII